MSEVAEIEARFELVELVGHGSWGEVFRGRDNETGGLVAVKRLHAHVRDETAVERFHREVRLLARVENEHVVRYVAHGPDRRGAPCLVVEWLVGEDLSRRQKRAPLSGAEVVDVARQIALGLTALHDAGIIHRDLKPANVFLVERKGAPVLAKLIDLGVAHAPAESTLTTEGVAIGTPYYMSPEQARGDQDVTAQSDLFSLGVLLFELTTGRRPFRGDDLFAVLAKIVLSDAPRLREAAPSLPRELDEIVGRALAKDPDHRFGSAREFADALALVPPFRVVRVGEPEAPADTVETAGLSGTLEQRVVTGVFAKLPHAADDALQKAVFIRLADALGGSPYSLLGRNVVAVFGGNRTRGDEVERAARSALAIAADIPGARIAVVTGKAIAGAAGLTGDVIERGTREVERAKRGAILVDTITSRLLADVFDVKDDAGARVLVGRRSSTTSPTASASMLPPRTLLGKPTPCLGRDRELSGLEALFDECIDESVARAVLVTGPAGSGKSRLRHELLSRLGDVPKLMLFGRGDSLAGGSAFSLLGNAIRRLASVLEGEPEAAQRAKIEALVGRNLGASECAVVAPLVGEIAGLAASTRGGDARLAGDRIRGAWEAWLEAESAAGPIVIVLDDLHAGDIPSVRLVDAALQALAEKPLFVVAFARPEVAQRFPDLFSGRALQHISLPALGRRAAERLVRVALGEASASELVGRLVERADGNPFFLEELIRAVAEHGPSAALPDTVLGVVQARLDALGADAKRLLRAASVFGESFWRGGVARILGGSRRTASAGDELDDLARREVLTKRREARFPNEAEYVFRHALVREAAYASLIDEDRVLAHRLAASWLEDVGERDAVVLAEHHERGGDELGAMNYYLRGAEQALRGSDFDQAIARASRVVAVGGELAGAAALVAAEAYRWKGDLENAAARASAAAELLTPASAPWFQAIREAIAANGRLGRMDIVESWARESSEAVAADDARGAQLATLPAAAVHLTYVGRPAAADLAARAEAIFATVPDVEPVVEARVHQMRAIIAGHSGDFETELAEQRAALDAFERAGDLRNACTTRVNMGFAMGQLGDLDEALAMLRKGHETAERMHLDTVGPLALHNMGLILWYLGDPEAGRVAELAAVEVFSRQGDPRLEAACRIYLARILGELGEVEEAEAEARKVIHGAAVGGVRVGALAALARILVRTGRAVEAVAISEEAAFLLDRHGAEEFDSLARLARVEALDAVGDRDGSRAALADALAHLLARASALRDPARRESLLRRIPEHARLIALAERAGVPATELG